MFTGAADPRLRDWLSCGGRLAVRIADQRGPDAFAESASAPLTAAERQECAQLGSGRRRDEWLAARACLKTLLVEAGLAASAGECEVRKDRRGKPTVFTAGLPRHCSLSHKGPYVAAAVALQPRIAVGIDVEQISPRLRAVQRRYVNRLDRLRPADDGDRFFAATWALKEASSKVTGLGIGLGWETLVCSGDEEGSCRIAGEAGFAADARYCFLGDYAVAVAWVEAPTVVPMPGGD